MGIFAKYLFRIFISFVRTRIDPLFLPAASYISNQLLATLSNDVVALILSSIPSTLNESRTDSTLDLASLIVFPRLLICLRFPVTGSRGASSKHSQAVPDFNLTFRQCTFYPSINNLTLIHL